MSANGAVVDPHVKAQAAGLERWFRKWTFDLVNRVVVALIIVGGLATALSSRSRGAMLASALSSLLVAAIICALVIVRYLGIRRRLASDPTSEVARLSQKPGKHQREFFAGGPKRVASPRAGEFSEDFDPNAPDTYGALRDVDILGQKSESSQDGVNRTEDPRRGPID
ncbi:MAG TPA: hypothetical protein VII84_05930 [Acidimicrobiales bacterium]